MTDRIYSIYKATNKINNKSYIGFASNWPRRKYDHNSNAGKHNTLFSNALNKYGKENFNWEVIFQSLDKNYTVNIMEPYFIKEYNSYFENNFGYNMTLGGESHEVSQEIRKKISESKKGKTKPNSGSFVKGHKKNTGKYHSLETKEKISKSKKGIFIPNFGQFKKGYDNKKTQFIKGDNRIGKETQFKNGMIPWNKILKEVA